MSKPGLSPKKAASNAAVGQSFVTATEDPALPIFKVDLGNVKGIDARVIEWVTRCLR